jgi:hypothetical protein
VYGCTGAQGERIAPRKGVDQAKNAGKGFSIFSVADQAKSQLKGKKLRAMKKGKRTEGNEGSKKGKEGPQWQRTLSSKKRSG